jgi:hypothetical protein
MYDNPFTDDWRDSLRAHYLYVVRENDHVTLRTLVSVMHQVGYTDDDLRQMYLEATIRADDLPDDFLPDMAYAQPPEAAAPPQQVEAVGAYGDAPATSHDEPPPDEPEAHDGDEDEPPSPPSDAPRQLSLF